jgi:hypothetical protein
VRTLLVIPCLRERGRLPQFLPGLLSALRSAGAAVDVLMVDDGSGAEGSKLPGNLQVHRICSRSSGFSSKLPVKLIWAGRDPLNQALYLWSKSMLPN